MAGIKDLMEAVASDPYFNSAPAPTGPDEPMPSVPYDNRLLAELIKSDPRFKGTNIGSNPSGYLDPRYESGLTKYLIDLGKAGTVQGEYYLKHDPSRNEGGRLWTSTSRDDPYSFLRTLVHENIHANTMEGPARVEGSRSTPSHTSYLNSELMDMEHAKLPTYLTSGERISALANSKEPIAWVGSNEAMLPSGQMPIQEEMNRRGLGALYAHMTTAGPVATRWDPSVIDALKAYIGHDDDTLQHHGPAVTKRVRNYIESELAPEEPYELKGNPKKGKNKGGSVAAIVANNQRLRLRRRR